ncbi:MAG TPA: acyl carrier protein [Herpetosiphonaceae bacterium]
MMLQEYLNTPLSRSEIATIVKNILISEAHINIRPEAISEDEALHSELLRITSLSFLGIILSLEEALDISMEDELFMKTQFRTVGDLVNFIDQLYRSR